MKKFMVLYMGPAAEFEKMMANSTPEQQKAGMDAWMKWSKDHKASIADMGAPLGHTKRASVSGVTDVKNEIGGYSVVQADSLETAAGIFSKDHPHFAIPGAYIEVMEIMPMPGM